MTCDRAATQVSIGCARCARDGKLHTCSSTMPTWNSTPQASKGSADPLVPDCLRPRQPGGAGQAHSEAERLRRHQHAREGEVGKGRDACTCEARQQTTSTPACCNVQQRHAAPHHHCNLAALGRLTVKRSGCVGISTRERERWAKVATPAPARHASRPPAHPRVAMSSSATLHHHH